MAQVQNVVNASSILPQPPASAANDQLKSSVQDTTDRFLTLLITQMRNQDPLNPLDNAQITMQLAQLNTVSGINQLNETLTSLAATFAASQMLQASSMIGGNVMVTGSDLSLSGGQALFGASLPQAVDSLVVDITDATGRLVHRAQAGPQQAGIVALQWDGAMDSGGTAPDGRYRFTLTATANGKAVDATALSVGGVIGVGSSNGAVQLNLRGGSSVPLTSVKQII